MIKTLGFLVGCVLMVAVAKADQPPPDIAATPPNPAAVPPTPFADTHGVFDSVSQCWLWDADRRQAMKTIFEATLAVDRTCTGAVLQGQAKIVWHSGPHDGETWDGVFNNGRLTGTAAFTSDVGNRRTGYVDGLRDGHSIAIFKDGGRLEEDFSAGLRKGAFLDSYPDGTRTEGQFENGRPVGHWVKTLRDRSRELSDGETPKTFDTPYTYVSPDGRTMPGPFIIAHIDMSVSPRVAYPPIAVRLGEQGTAVVSSHVMADGTAQEVRLIRSSGFQRLDDALMTFMTTVHYKPATLDGVPMASYVVLSQTFNLRSPQ